MTGQAVSDFFGFDPRWLRKLEEQGFVQRDPETRLFDAGAVAQGTVRWLRDDARRNNKTEGAKRTEELKHKKLEIEIAKELRELVDLETVELTFTEIFTALRIAVDSVPAGVTRDLALRSKIEALIDGAFDRCRGAFEGTVAALRDGRPLLDGEDTGEP